MTTTGTRGGGIGPTDRGRTGTGTAALVPVPEALIVVVRIETVRIAAVPIAAGRTATVGAVTAPEVTGRTTVGRTATVVAATAPVATGRTANIRPATVRREASVHAARVAVAAAPSDVGTTRATVRVFRGTGSVAGDTAGTTLGREPGVTIADRTTGVAASGTPGPAASGTPGAAAGGTPGATRSGPTPRTPGCGTTVVGTSAAPRTRGTSAVTTTDDRGAALPPPGRTPTRSGPVPWMNEGSRSRGRQSAPSSPSGMTRPAREPGVEVRMGRASRPAICPRESACRR